MFILTVVATAYKPNSFTELEWLENTVTRLFVRITEHDYSFFMPVQSTLKKTVFESLNPLKEQYIPRMLSAKGVKLTIQDLVLSRELPAQPSKKSIYNIIFEVLLKLIKTLRNQEFN